MVYLAGKKVYVCFFNNGFFDRKMIMVWMYLLNFSESRNSVLFYFVIGFIWDLWWIIGKRNGKMN